MVLREHLRMDPRLPSLLRLLRVASSASRTTGGPGHGADIQPQLR